MFHFGDVTVDEGRMLVTRAGQPVDLEPKALRVLLHLMAHRERVVTKEELFAEVWEGVAVGDNALTRVVAQLRKSLGDDARRAKYIETVPTVGYRFVGELGTAAPTPEMKRRISPQWWWWAVAALPVTAALAWGVWERGRPVDAPLRAFAPRQVTNSPSLDASPALSPDGAMLVYSSDRTGRFELYLRQLSTGGREVALTADGANNVHAAWSPDGRWLAYHAVARGGIWVMPALGGTARRVSEFGSQPAWSPDGEWIAFRSANLISLAPVDSSTVEASELWVARAKTGEARRLVRGAPLEAGVTSPAWSADGRHLVFGHGRGIDVVTLESGARRSLLKARSGALLSPTVGGGFVYYAEMVKAMANVIWRLKVTPAMEPVGEPQEVARLGGTPQELKATGRQLTYSLVTMDSNLWRLGIDAEGGPLDAPAPLTRNTNYRNSSPSVSPDGERVVFLARRIGRTPELTLMNMDGTGEEVLLPESTGPMVHRHFTADGRAVFYVRGNGPEYQAELVDLATRQSRPVGRVHRVPGALGLAWGTRLLSDERRVLMHGRRGPGVGIGIFDLVKGELRWLTEEGQAIAFPSLSPDGQWVAAERFENHGSNLVVMPLAGGKAVRLTEGPGQAWAHSWSPDGDKVAFAGQREGAWNLYWKSRTSGQERRLTAETSARTFVRYPEWAAKGNRMVYERVDVKGNVYLVDLAR